MQWLLSYLELVVMFYQQSTLVAMQILAADTIPHRELIAYSHFMSASCFVIGAFAVAWTFLLRELQVERLRAKIREFKRKLPGPNRVRNHKRRLARLASPLAPGRLKKKTKFDHKRGAKCVNDDYWSATAKWKHGEVFERTFGVTKELAKRLVALCIKKNPSIFPSPEDVEASGRDLVYAHVKILNVLKLYVMELRSVLSRTISRSVSTELSEFGGWSSHRSYKMNDDGALRRLLYI